MTGPEHYREAEQLLAEVTNDDGTVSLGEGGEGIIGAAICHALLAGAAASALNDAGGTVPAAEWHAWRVAAGYPGVADHAAAGREACSARGERR